MKDKIRKIAGWRPEPSLYVGAAAAVLVLLLLPLLRLAGYSVPWYDDYNYGRFAKTAMEEAPNFVNALKGAAECIRISWYAWQGTYSSILFMVLMPGIWGEEYYRFGPIFLILFLTVAVCVLVGTLLRNALKADWQHTLGISMVSAAMTVVLIHTAQAGFYWYNGGVHYVGMHAFGMLLLAVAVKIFCADKESCADKSKRWKRVLLAVTGAVLAFLVAGGNFVTSLQGLLVLLGMVGMGCFLRRRQTFAILPMLCVYAGGFWLNVTAPGNDKRAESYVGWGMSPVKAVAASFVEGVKHLWVFTGWMGVIFLVLMLPLIWSMVKKTDFSFRWPGLVSLGSLCLYATGFTPSLYSLGHAGLGRTLNAVKLTWQLLLILNVVYWCGWLCRCLERKGRTITGRMSRWWFYPLVAAAALLVFWTEPNKAGSFSSYGAYHYIHTGEAYNFYQEYLERVALLQGDEDIVVLSPYQWKPWFLCMGDLSENPEDEANRSLALWYGKDEVICSGQ
jgi:hypothetical protein